MSDADKAVIAASQFSEVELAAKLGFSRKSIHRYAKRIGIMLPRKKKPARIFHVEIGGRYGRLSVMARTARGRHFFWICDCDCGTRGLLRPTATLFNAAVPSCGCYLATQHKTKRIRDGEATAHSLYCTYRANARRRSRQFELPFESFYSICQKDCHYCGRPPHRTARRGNAATPFIYNGVDRVDSTMGYVPGNCVPCCKSCNVAKNDMNIAAFADLVVRLHNRLPRWRS